MTNEGQRPEMTPVQRLEIAREGMSRSLMDPNATGVRMTVQILELQNALFLNATDIPPQDMYQELAQTTQGAIDRLDRINDPDGLTVVSQLHEGYSAALDSYTDKPADTQTQPTRTEELPPMTGAKGTVLQELKADDEVRVQSPPLSQREQQGYDLLDQTDSPISREDLAKALGVGPSKIPDLISRLRAKGKKIEAIYEKRKAVAFRILRNPNA